MYSKFPLKLFSKLKFTLKGTEDTTINSFTSLLENFCRQVPLSFIHNFFTSIKCTSVGALNALSTYE